MRLHRDVLRVGAGLRAPGIPQATPAVLATCLHHGVAASPSTPCVVVSSRREHYLPATWTFLAVSRRAVPSEGPMRVRLSPDGAHPLVLTGERTLPGIPEENYWFARHVAAYEHAAGCLAEACLPAGRPVVDSGCGEGYGTSILSRALAADVLGLDLFADAVSHAAGRYPDSIFVRSDASAVPVRDATMGAVVSLQVIEHLADPAAYVAECSRILHPGGVFVVATPNRLTFTPPGRPKNPFHVVEFTESELRGLLAREFPSVTTRGVHDRHPGLADTLVDAAFAGEVPPDWARALVPEVTPSDFEIRECTPDCLDLIAICRT